MSISQHKCIVCRRERFDRLKRKRGDARPTGSVGSDICFVIYIHYLLYVIVFPKKTTFFQYFHMCSVQVVSVNSVSFCPNKSSMKGLAQLLVPVVSATSGGFSNGTIDSSTG